MKIKSTALTAFVILLLLSGTKISAQDIGETAFKQTCAACHSIGKGRLVGPDLANIQDKKPEDWIISFIKSSQSVIKSGDKYADSIYQAYGRTLMPDHPALTDDQISGILAYIKTKSAAPASGTTATTTGQATQKTEDKLFSTINIFLFGAILFMLLVILFLARINKGLLEQLKDYYSSDRAFFK